ncbi:MAG: hypothetical protein DMG38_23335 [Acidobacteria bacterium]|nr:MAG: hypothetical protein DMG38_23335 [Acidobacteriota bacterium]
MPVPASSAVARPAKSHYCIRGGKVRWAGMWSQKEIDAGRAADRLAKNRYFETDTTARPATPEKEKQPFWRKLKWW